MTFRKWVAAFVFVASFPALGFAQTEGRFSGTVLDPSGAIVPNATVVLKNERTGEERTVTSSPQGRYLVPNLKPSLYSLRATLASFAPVEFSELPLAAGQEFNLDLEFHPVGVAE